jgi:hypothetical protein
MVAKSIKLPATLDARLRHEAHARRRSYSVVLRDAIVRGLDTGHGINMAEALKDFIGSASGPGDLSTNKAYFRDIGRKRAR